MLLRKGIGFPKNSPVFLLTDYANDDKQSFLKNDYRTKI